MLLPSLAMLTIIIMSSINSAVVQAVYKCRSHLKAGLVLTADLQSLERNKRPRVYSKDIVIEYNRTQVDLVYLQYFKPHVSWGGH